MFDILPDDLTSEETRSLLALHLSGMREDSPEGHVYALDLSGLKEANVTMWSAWDGSRIAGIGALKDLGDGTGEIKSMRTHPDYLRRGVAAAILDHLVSEARQRGLRRLSLETGSGPSFEAASALYRRRGFTAGEAFGGYRASEFNRFMHLAIGEG
jgi:putative acetyltransferase